MFKYPLLLFSILCLASTAHAEGHLLYFGAQGVAGYSSELYKGIFYSQNPDAEMQKPSLGFDYIKRTLPRKEKCPVCGMFVSLFPDWNARVEFKDASYSTFDGAKCMFKYYLNIKKYNPLKEKKDVTAISVKDYDSKTSIDALRAFYVIWSDVYGPMGHEPIPFEKEADAKRFLKEHKGKKILRFKDINQKLITSLDNPP